MSDILGSNQASWCVARCLMVCVLCVCVFNIWFLFSFPLSLSPSPSLLDLPRFSVILSSFSFFSFHLSSIVISTLREQHWIDICNVDKTCSKSLVFPRFPPARLWIFKGPLSMLICSGLGWSPCYKQGVLLGVALVQRPWKSFSELVQFRDFSIFFQNPSYNTMI